MIEITDWDGLSWLRPQLSYPIYILNPSEDTLREVAFYLNQEGFNAHVSKEYISSGFFIQLGPIIAYILTWNNQFGEKQELWSDQEGSITIDRYGNLLKERND